MHKSTTMIQKRINQSIHQAFRTMACSVFSGESSEVYFLLKCVLSSQWLIKNKLERIPEVFTVKSLKPAVRARASEHLEEAFSLQ